MQIGAYAILIRKILFGLAIGVGFFAIVLYSKPMLERTLLKVKFDDNMYYWGEIIVAIFLALLAMLII